MNIDLTLVDMLIDYDGPQLVSLQDELGCLWLGLAVPPALGIKEPFMLVRTTQPEIDGYENDEISLRSAFVKAETYLWDFESKYILPFIPTEDFLPLR